MKDYKLKQRNLRASHTLMGLVVCMVLFFFFNKSELAELERKGDMHLIRWVFALGICFVAAAVVDAVLQIKREEENLPNSAPQVQR
jgi:hypothetical protein